MYAFYFSAILKTGIIHWWELNSIKPTTHPQLHKNPPFFLVIFQIIHTLPPTKH